eukprot:jgi/Botrbrau1/12637/Bobra.67_1s0003.1
MTPRVRNRKILLEQLHLQKYQLAGEQYEKELEQARLALRLARTRRRIVCKQRIDEAFKNRRCENLHTKEAQETEHKQSLEHWSRTQAQELRVELGLRQKTHVLNARKSKMERDVMVQEISKFDAFLESGIPATGLPRRGLQPSNGQNSHSIEATKETKGSDSANLEHLLRLSMEEAALLESQVWIDANKGHMEEMRRDREERYRAQREAQGLLEVQREAEAQQQMQEQCLKSAELHLNEFSEQQKDMETKRLRQISQFCAETLLQVVEVGREIADYREKKEAKLPRHAWQNLKNAFLSGNIPLPTECEASPPEPPHVEEVSVSDYVMGCGPWDPKLYGLEEKEITPELRRTVGQLAVDCRETTPPEDLKPLPQGLKLMVLGPPMSGKTSIAQYLGTTYGLKVLEQSSLVTCARACAERLREKLSVPGIGTSLERALLDIGARLNEVDLERGPVPDSLLAELFLEVMRNVDQYITLSEEMSGPIPPGNEKNKRQTSPECQTWQDWAS